MYWYILLLVPFFFRGLFSTHNKAKANLNLRKIGNLCVSDVATASVHSEKTRLKKMIMIIIIISMNKSQELTVFHGRQKLTSFKN